MNDHGDVRSGAPPGLETIVRFHDVDRLPELRRCIFSLVGQRHRPLGVIVTLQRFTPAQVDRTREALAPLLAMADAPGVRILNCEAVEPRDARSDLLNVSLAAARERFVAFLDYDDVLYPDAYERIVGRMLDTEASIAFASVRVVRVDVHEHFQFVREVVPSPFSGTNLVDLFRSNFCPIHSYVIDRGRVPPDVLRFDSSLTWEEDYDFLLRICAKFRSDFSLLGTIVGDYVYKRDGSNTVPTNGAMAQERAAEYEIVRQRVEARRRTTEISADVQRALGVRRPVPGLTIRQFLDSRDARQRARWLR